jgi:hypothetical protein
VGPRSTLVSRAAAFVRRGGTYPDRPPGQHLSGGFFGFFHTMTEARGFHGGAFPGEHGGGESGGGKPEARGGKGRLPGAGGSRERGAKRAPEAAGSPGRGGGGRGGGRKMSWVLGNQGAGAAGFITMMVVLSGGGSPALPILDAGRARFRAGPAGRAGSTTRLIVYRRVLHGSRLPAESGNRLPQSKASMRQGRAEGQVRPHKGDCAVHLWRYLAGGGGATGRNMECRVTSGSAGVRLVAASHGAAGRHALPCATSVTARRAATPYLALLQRRCGRGRPWKPLAHSRADMRREPSGWTSARRSRPVPQAT